MSLPSRNGTSAGNKAEQDERNCPHPAARKPAQGPNWSKVEGIVPPRHQKATTIYNEQHKGGKMRKHENTMKQSKLYIEELYVCHGIKEPSKGEEQQAQGNGSENASGLHI